MIVGEQKPLEAIEQMVQDFKKVLIAGCNTCVAICFAGGEKEVGILASALRMRAKIADRKQEIVEQSVQRQCEWEFVDELKDNMGEVEAVVSLACGAGVQALAERFPATPVLPGLNTTGIAITEEAGVWGERCLACGDCILDKTGGICPITRCSKSLLNGPCGGLQKGKCEISPDVLCAWQEIYDRLKGLGRLDLLNEVKPPKNWSTSQSGGPRRIVREDLRIEPKGQ